MTRPPLPPSLVKAPLRKSAWPRKMGGGRLFGGARQGGSTCRRAGDDYRARRSAKGGRGDPEDCGDGRAPAAASTGLRRDRGNRGIRSRAA